MVQEEGNTVSSLCLIENIPYFSDLWILLCILKINLFYYVSKIKFRGIRTWIHYINNFKDLLELESINLVFLRKFMYI